MKCAALLDPCAQLIIVVPGVIEWWMNGNNKTTPSSNAVNRQQTKLIEQEQQKELINEVLKSVDQDLQKDSPDNQTAPQLNKELSN